MKNILTGIVMIFVFALAVVTLPVWGPIALLWALGRSWNEFDPNEPQYPDFL